MKSKKSPSKVSNFPNKSKSNSKSPKILSKSQRYNKRVVNCLKGCSLTNNNNIKKNIGNVPFKTEKEYNDSFDDIKVFSKKITAAKKKSINCIVFNKNNADGILSAMLVANYLRDNKKSNISFVNTAPNIHNGINGRIKSKEHYIKGKSVIILDLAYGKKMIDYFKSTAKDLIIIDDHGDNSNKSDDNIFVGKVHGTVAYTWKFLYPTKNIPIYIQSFDNDDRALYLPYLKHGKSFTTFLNYRAFHSPYHNMNFTKMDDFNKLDDIISNSNMEFMDVVGHYYDEVANNIKEQIAQHAKLRYFDGYYPVYVLNYKDPVLYKMVAKQMITNAKKKGDNIAFAVLWGYEYTLDCYNIHISEGTGNNPKYNLPMIAKKLGEIGGTGKGGFGSKNVGNFYWPHEPGKDIWDLISKFKKDPKFLKL